MNDLRGKVAISSFGRRLLPYFGLTPFFPVDSEGATLLVVWRWWRRRFRAALTAFFPVASLFVSWKFPSRSPAPSASILLSPKAESGLLLPMILLPPINSPGAIARLKNTRFRFIGSLF
jgi:hypothetical protein